MKRALAALVVLAAACSSSHAATTRTVTVFAAASLTKAFAAEATAYQQTHPGDHVVLSFAGSQTLVAQIQQGAPADVIATADAQTMGTLRSRVRSAPAVLAHNELAIVTAPRNPLHLTSLGDLARNGIRVVLAGPTVPAGKAAAKALAQAKVTVHPVSLEDAVTGVITKIRLGEADAGIAYVTDVGDGVAGTSLPGTTTTLDVAPLDQAGDGFVAFVLSPAGQAILRAHGFR